MPNTTDTTAASRLTSSSTTASMEAYFTAILRGTTFLPQGEPARAADRPAWFDAAAWPAAPASR